MELLQACKLVFLDLSLYTIAYGHVPFTLHPALQHHTVASRFFSTVESLRFLALKLHRNSGRNYWARDQELCSNGDLAREVSEAVFAEYSVKEVMKDASYLEETFFE